MTQQTKTINLSEGPILSQLCAFALPILVGQLFQTLYNSVDSVIVGNLVGVLALSAVSASSMIANLLVGFFNGLSTGASVLAAREFGANEYPNLRRTMHTTMAFSVILGAFVALAGVFLTPALLSVVDCPDEVRPLAQTYLRIYMASVFFISIYNVGAGMLRAVGDSKSPFHYLVLSSCLNVVLDLFFVAVCGLGVAGVAIATLIAQMISCALVFRRLSGLDPAYRFHFSELRVEGPILSEVLRLGLPAGLQASITSISAMFVQRYINSFSPVALAGITSGMKIDQFACMPCNAVGLAMTTYIGQNVGAKRNDRLSRGVVISTITCICIGLMVSVPAFTFARYLIRIFGSDEEMIAYGAGFLRTVMPWYLIMCMMQLYGGIVRGYGYSLTAMCMTIFGMVVCRQIWLAVSLNMNHVITNVYMGYIIGWAGAAIPLVLFYLLKLRATGATGENVFASRSRGSLAHKK